MTNGFVELRDVDSLDRFIAEANGTPIVIFKHSETCGISARAFVEMQRFAVGSANGVPVGIIAIQAARAVSDEIEARTGIEHESPQVLVIRNGQVVWSGSHGEVKADRVAKALETAVGSRQ